MPSRTGARLSYIDWTRGLAVLLMIEAHTLDAWTRVADRKTAAFGYLTILGGFAAPLFLWLAGLGVVLSASRIAERTGSRHAAVESVCRRGLEIFILAFLFRLQAFIVSPGSHPVTIFRVDVLNVMGPAMVATGLAWRWAESARGQVVLFSALAAGVSMATPIIRSASSVDLLPTWIQWYVRPAGEFTTFTLFPWAGFVFAGAAAGPLIGARRLQLWLGAAGLAAMACGFYFASRASIYAVPTSFWTSSPTWFAIRVGVMMMLLAALSRIRASGPWLTPLAVLGRASLFVYWIHVELVYGYASWLWRRRLPIWAGVAAWLAFTVLMYGAVVARDWLLTRKAVVIPRLAT